MEVRDNVRQRRQERIRNIQNNYQPESVSPYANGQGSHTVQEGYPAKGSSPWQGSYSGQGSHPGQARLPQPDDAGYPGVAQRPFGRKDWLTKPVDKLPLFHDGKLDDPEFVWREQEKYWRSLAAEEEAGGPGGPSFLLPTRRQLWMKLILCGVLFAAVTGMFRMHTPWAEQGQQFVLNALTKDMNFAAVEAWYQEKFSGSPSLIPTFHIKGGEARKVDAGSPKTFATPVHGQISAEFAPGHQWIGLKTAAGAVVHAMDDGLVVFAGVRTDSGYTVVLQHPDGYESTYGWLSPGSWQKNDWVKSGTALGTVSPDNSGNGKFYIAVMKDQEYINPADVVTFD